MIDQGCGIVGAAPPASLAAWSRARGCAARLALAWPLVLALVLAAPPARRDAARAGATRRRQRLGRHHQGPVSLRWPALALVDLGQHQAPRSVALGMHERARRIRGSLSITSAASGAGKGSRIVLRLPAAAYAARRCAGRPGWLARRCRWHRGL